jgi:hypothetical protein
MTAYDAKTLATSWLAVAQASQPDKNRPILHSTILVETFPEGVRLAATDTYMLLTAWVPTEDDEYATEPALDDAPVSAAVAMDPDGRARQFMGYLHKLTSGEDAETVSVRMNVSAHDEDGAFAGMAATWVTLDYPDHEKLMLRCCEGEYPNWRHLVDGFVEKRTTAVALNPEILGRLSKLGKLGGSSLIWHWSGHDKPAKVELADTTVRGLVMPQLARELREEEAA